MNINCYYCRHSNVYDLLDYLIPYGWLDLKRCGDIVSDSCINLSDFSDYYYQFITDLNLNFNDMPDICYIAYDYILNLVRNEIEEKTNIDILNDLDNEIFIHGNYMCTSYSWYDNKSTIEVINRIPIDERSYTLDWFYSEIGGV